MKKKKQKQKRVSLILPDDPDYMTPMKYRKVKVWDVSGAICHWHVDDDFDELDEEEELREWKR